MQLSKEELKRCKRYPDVGCPDDVARECLQDCGPYCGKPAPQENNSAEVFGEPADYYQNYLDREYERGKKR